jgi:nucleoside 2-deoxyribosyltransferase
MSRGSRPRVYLAGPITGLTYDGATDWRKAVTEELLPEVIGVSPMRGKGYLAQLTVIEDAKKQQAAIGGTSEDLYGLKQVMSSPQGITGRDRWDVETCDAVLMNLLGAERVSIGTMIEAGWADAHRKPLIVVREPKNIHAHGMLDAVATYTVGTLEEGLHLTKMLFYKGDA